MSEERGKFTIRLAREADWVDVLRLLRENFDREETMLRCLRKTRLVTDNDEVERTWLEHERLIRAALRRGACLVALEEKGDHPIGVNLMIMCDKAGTTKAHANDAFGIFELLGEDPPKTELMREYFGYLAEIEDKARLFDVFEEARIGLEFYAIAVDREHREQGLSRLLMREGIAYAKSRGDVDFVFGVYTSLYSKKAAKQLGLKSYHDVDLLAYRDSIFRDCLPHNVVSVMALKI